MRLAIVNPDELQKHIAGTYFTLRVGIGVLAAALPVVLWLGGRFFDHEPLRCSMSAYYYSPSMRDELVGILCAIGLFLILYKGFSRQENWALNIAGILAIGIALIPTDPSCTAKTGLTVHAILALLFFGAIAFVALTRASDTLSLIHDEGKAERLRNVYRALGVLMIASPLLAAAMASLLEHASPKRALVFFVETFAVLTFAAYWIAKSVELRATNADELAAEAKLRVAAAPPKGLKRRPGRLVQVGSDDVLIRSEEPQ
jgi:hypothetical protein